MPASFRSRTLLAALSALVFSSLGLAQTRAVTLQLPDPEAAPAHVVVPIAGAPRALELTYDLVATTMQDHDLEYLLSRFMHRVADVLGADAAVARLEQSGQLKLVDRHGLNAASPFTEPSVSSRLLRDRDNPDSAPVGVRTANFSEHMAARVSEMTLLTLPLRFKGEMLGCYQFFIEGQESLGQNTQLLLENVS